MKVVAGANFCRPAFQSSGLAGQLAKNDRKPGNRCEVLADAVNKAVQDGSSAAPIASTASALTFPGVVKQRGKGRSFNVTLDIGVEVQAGLKSLVPASSKVELEGFDEGHISENELSSNASEGQFWDIHPFWGITGNTRQPRTNNII